MAGAFPLSLDGRPFALAFAILAAACVNTDACPVGSGGSGSVACATGMCSGGACSGQTTTGTSCRASGEGRTNCGSATESCCASIEVSGGTYYRTYTNDGTGPTGEADPATVSGFRLDKYDVTVGRFRQFVNAWKGGWMPPAGSGKHTHLNGGKGLANSAPGSGYELGWVVSDDSNIAPTDANLASCTPSTWTNTATTQENKPINCVNWYEAYAFCIWDGGAFLPSEAEWEYAAAGGSEQREFPWGSADPNGMNQYAIYQCHYPDSATLACSDVSNIAHVGTAVSGAGRWGQLDLVGNLSQWNLDFDYTAFAECTDCAYLTMTAAASARGIRGADFASSPGAPTLYWRPPVWSHTGFAPVARAENVGFRCSRTP